MNIVTSICVDEDDNDVNINYPSTLHASAEDRRLIYWKCVLIFMATSVRCNPSHTHTVYTNDRKEVFYKKTNIKDFLKKLGVDIKLLPFETFKPPAGYSKNFKNAFYKLDVMKALGTLPDDTYSIVVDSDCVWIKPNDELITIMKEGKVLLYDVYKSFKEKKDKFDDVRIKLGSLYKEIDEFYPTQKPIQFGGEIVGTNSQNFKILTLQMEDAFNKIISIYDDQPLRLDENRKIFDGMEMLTSYVYNNMALPYYNLKDYIARIWNTLRGSTATEADMNLTIWHLPSEKTQGFPLLYNQVINKKSTFWKVPVSEFKNYLGGYLGVPKHVVPKRYFMLFRKVVQSAKRHLPTSKAK